MFTRIISERSRSMFEVIATHTDGRERKKIVFTMERARYLVDRALEKRWKVQIRKLYIDVWIADRETGEYWLYRSRIPHAEAWKRTKHFMRIDAERGCLMWPHGRPMPQGWRVVRAEG